MYGGLAAVAAVLLLCSTTAEAVGSWYYGKVQRIHLYSDAGFVMKFDSTALDDCQWQYVYIRTPNYSERGVDRALSIALAAQASGRTVGVVIDKTINGPGGQCDSNGQIDIRD